ncbi:MAG: hypothetical protein IJ191_09165 [Treponema sp.]|nr:hypothetical protein [Treponema sp.]
MSSNDGKRGAKDYSLFAQIFAAIWISGWSAFKFAKIIIAGDFAALDISDIVFSAFSIAACFVPVYFSIILDKVKDIRFGGGK